MQSKRVNTYTNTHLQIYPLRLHAECWSKRAPGWLMCVWMRGRRSLCERNECVRIYFSREISADIAKLYAHSLAAKDTLSMCCVFVHLCILYSERLEVCVEYVIFSTSSHSFAGLYI